MVEYLDAYNEQGELVKTGDKETILDDIKRYSIKNGDANLAVPVVFLLLVHPDYGLYVVKRAAKSENPYLWCKTVGGHVRHGETADVALERESMEEIKTKVKIEHSIDDYLLSIGSCDFTQVALVRQIDFKPWLGIDRIDRETGMPWRRRFRAHIYSGFFERTKLEFTQGTGLRTFDDGLGEAVECNFYQIDTLKELLEKGDRRFTHDLTVLVKNYHALLSF